jgi:iron complex transport system permease protein
MSNSKGAYATFIIIAAFLTVACFLVSLAVGRFPVSVGNVLRILFAPGRDSLPKELSLAHSVIINIRLPRVLLALAGGIGLGVTGAVFQGVFRNPLVSPGVI